MERHEVLEMMATLKLAGMRDAFDELLADGLKRRHPVQRIIGELLKAEIADKQARSIKYQMSVAKLPLAKELADFEFTDTPVNEPLVPRVGGWWIPGQPAQRRADRRDRHRQEPSRRRHRAGLYPRRRPRPLLQQPAPDLIGGRRPGQPARDRSPHRPPGPTRRPAGPARSRRPRRTRLSALRTSRRPAAVPPRQPALRAHLDHRHNQPDLRRMALRLRRRQDDHRAPRSPDAPLRDHRDRQRELAFQEPVLTATDPPVARSPRWAHRNLPRAVRRQPDDRRVGPRAGPSYGLPGRPPPCVPEGVNIAHR